MDGIELALRDLMEDVMGEGSDPEDREGIIKLARRRIDDPDASESEMLDAILDSFDRTSSNTPSRIVVDDPDDFDQILDSLVKTAGNTLNLTTGSDAHEYDPKSRTYVRGNPSSDDDEEEFLIDDGVHEDVAFGLATRTKGVARTRKDMLHRE